MPSTYSSNLKIELIATGEQDGTWGTTTNTNLGTALEQAITGAGTITFASADVTLSFVSSNASQDFRNIRLVLTGTTAGPRNLVVPSIQKIYFIDNQTADTITVKTSLGSGVAVPSNSKSVMFANTTDVVEAITHFNSLTAVSPTFSGTPTAPTAAPGTNTTQVATTAFTTAAITTATGSLGTMSTQNANNVAITGGSITGITDLAIADGGTGASTAPNARTNLGLAIGTDIPSPTGTGASGTWNISISGTAATATTANNAIGVGQTWQSVSRSLGVNYTNSTGRSIMVSVTTSNYFSYTYVYVNGNNIGYSNDNDFGGRNMHTFIVPNGNTYQVAGSSGNTQLQLWWELR